MDLNAIPYKTLAGINIKKNFNKSQTFRVGRQLNNLPCRII